MVEANHTLKTMSSVAEGVKTLVPGIVELKDEGKVVSGYQLEHRHVGAIQAAYLAGRPLLVKGDPGTGKTLLARAIAELFGWRFLKAVVHYNTSIDDLLYEIDHLKRLDHANRGVVDDKQNYLNRGTVWKALVPNEQDNEGNEVHAKTSPRGTVLLIDEIDKADSTLPNALLEVLDTQKITIPCLDEPIRRTPAHEVLAVITSNEERPLPAAFIRRCAVVDLCLSDDEDQAKQQLWDIYQTHREHSPDIKAMASTLIDAIAVDVVVKRRGKALDEYKPGVSEFLDVVRAVGKFPEGKREEHWENIACYLVDKSQ